MKVLPTKDVDITLDQKQKVKLKKGKETNLPDSVANWLIKSGAVKEVLDKPVDKPTTKKETSKKETSKKNTSKKNVEVRSSKVDE